MFVNQLFQRRRSFVFIRYEFLELSQHVVRYATLGLVVFDEIGRSHDAAPIPRRSEVFTPFQPTQAHVFLEVSVRHHLLALLVGTRHFSIRTVVERVFSNLRVRVSLEPAPLVVRTRPLYRVERLGERATARSHLLRRSLARGARVVGLQPVEDARGAEVRPARAVEMARIVHDVGAHDAGHEGPRDVHELLDARRLALPLLAAGFRG